MDTLHEPKFTSLRYKVLGSKDIQKPENDKREYKLVELENKLRVLLISDPQTDKAATALNVHVGYYSDPKNLPGLAHFLEHLLFMGTEKYPNENDYSEYLSRHHGSSNAYTSHSQTNYYFEVNSNFLHGALDRFSQFFIAPLFSESCTERELLAVDSEHKNNLLKDFWRLSQVHKSLCPQDHPYSKFGTGNLETLRVLPQSNGIVVRNELIQFYHRYYSANIMCLVILGKESLDTLLGWADTLFSSIQNKDVQVPSSLIRNHPWDSLSFKEISQYIHVKSLKDLKALLLTWKIPTSPDWWPQKPSSYITHLLGHEGKGSILSCLKLKDWAMNLVAYTTHDSMHFEFLKLQIDLTDEGMKNIEEIVVLVFQYLKLLKSSEPHEWIFNEMKTLREINFRFKEIRSMSNYALELASILHEPYPPHQLLNGQFVPFVWDSSLIKKCLSTLDTTFQITVSTANDSSVKYVLKEPYYGTEYRVDSISSGLIERINNCQLHPNLSFPKPNPFLPRKLEVKPHKMNLDAPEIVHETKHTRLWYLRDHIFLIPQAFLKLSFKSPLILESVTNSALSDLLLLYIKDTMTEFIYDATLVGLDFSVYCNAKAIVLSVYGICDKFNLIVQEFVKTMLALDASHLSFTRLKSDLLRKYENWDFDPPYTHSIFQLRRAIQRPMYTPKEEFKALQNCTKEMFVTFVRQLCTTFFVESLYVGNEMVQNYVEWLRPSLSTFPVVTVSPLTVEAVRFPISNHIYRELGKDPINSAVIYSLQVCDESDFKLLTLLGLFVQLTQDQAFHKLRTEQQLGYIVFSNKLIWMNTGSYFVLVQSEKSAEALESYIESFLEHILVFLDEMSPSDYQSHVDAYVAKLLEKPKNLAELAELHWSYIASERYTFDALKKMADIAKAHQIQDIREFFLHYIHPSSSHARKFSAHYLSSNSEPAMVPNVTFIDNLTQWVSEQQKYDVPQGLLPACSNLSKFT